MTKKLMILFALFVFTNVSSFAQKEIYYRCTGNNVNIRRGPGTQYGRVKSAGGVKCPPMNNMQLFKGDIVIGNGIQKNGFIRITETVPYPCMDSEGWVSAKFLVRATKCTSCNGRGDTGRVCPECNGEGYGYCCRYSGMELCEKCGGIGYK